MTDNIATVKRDIHHIQRVKDVLYQLPGTTSETLNAGVTYIGQMFAHEIVGSKARRIKRSPKINMESLYGANIDDYLDDLGRFICGKSVRCNGNELRNSDLPVDSALSKVNIADKRNDENIFISQLHLL